MAPGGGETRRHRHNSIRIIGPVAKKALHHGAAEHGSDVGKIDAAIRLAQAAGRYELRANPPVAMFDSGIAIHAFQHRSLQQFPALVTLPRQKIPQRHRKVVAMEELANRPSARHPVGGLAHLTAIGELVFFHLPVSVIHRLPCLHRCRQPRLNRQVLAVDPGVVMDSLEPALLDVGAVAALPRDPEHPVNRFGDLVGLGIMLLRLLRLAQLPTKIGRAASLVVDVCRLLGGSTPVVPLVVGRPRVEVALVETSILRIKALLRPLQVQFQHRQELRCKLPVPRAPPVPHALVKELGLHIVVLAQRNDFPKAEETRIAGLPGPGGIWLRLGLAIRRLNLAFPLGLHGNGDTIMPPVGGRPIHNTPSQVGIPPVRAAMDKDRGDIEPGHRRRRSADACIEPGIRRLRLHPVAKGHHAGKAVLKGFLCIYRLFHPGAGHGDVVGTACPVQRNGPFQTSPLYGRILGP